jgi:CDP-4-dehydro-6-deoxyglucose reductase
MSRVKLFPSGSEFEVLPGQTILEAALSSGMTVPYQCDNGSCGNCRARIIEGSLAETRHHDYVFCGSEKQQPMLLMCVSSPATDMIIEPVLASSGTDIPLQQISTRVKKLERAGDDVMVVTLRTPRSNTLRFLAGQYVTLDIPQAGKRNKSIASCPCNGLDLQFHFRRQPGDSFAGYIFDELKTHATIEVSGPCGDFLLDEKSDRPVLMIAYDTGFSAMKSLIEHMISLESTQPVHLYWIVPDAKPYLDNQCRAWSDALDNFCYDSLPLDEARIIFRPITDDYASLHEHDVYLAVPRQLGDELSELLQDAGARDEHIYSCNMKRL